MRPMQSVQKVDNSRSSPLQGSGNVDNSVDNVDRYTFIHNLDTE